MARLGLWIWVFLSLGILSIQQVIHAEAKTNELFSVPLAKQLPVIDGKMGEDEWRDALSVYGVFDTTGNFEPRPAVLYAAYSEDKLFFAVKSELPPTGQLIAQIRQDGKDVPSDDSWEVWIHPVSEGSEEQDAKSYQLVGNAVGFKFNSFWENKGMGWKPLDWTPQWAYSSSTTGRWWMAEIAIPFSDIGIQPKGNPWRMKFNICRAYKNPSVYSSLTGASNFADARQMAVWIPDQAAPVVKLRKIHEDTLQDMEMVLDIMNPSANELSLKAMGQVKRTDGRVTQKEEAVKVPAGATVSLALLKELPIQEMIDVDYSVASEDMSKTFFSHHMKFRQLREKRWGAPQAVSPLSVIYLPSFNKLEVNYNCKPLIDKGEKIDAVNVIVKSENDRKEVFKAEIREFGKFSEAEALYTLPSLSTGKYSVEAIPCSGSKTGAGECCAFEKKDKFEWEDNILGISDEIVPPFTPMKVKKQTVSVVLREMEMGQMGLWDRVKSLDQEILSIPMAMWCESEGKELPWKGQNPRLVEERKDRVVFETEARNDAVLLHTRSVIEYDGFMKVEMDVTPMSTKPIDRMSLDIVMPEEVAYLMHAGNETIRSCPSGAIPPGTGTVWSNRLMPSQLDNKFVPYIWIGGEEKGMCWMANDEKDWSLESRQPMMELVREKGTVNLRIHFINRRTTLDRKRQWVFGVMATPVKPMPDGWRKWSWLWCAVGTHYAPSTWCDPFPKDRDFSLLAGLKKTADTGEIDQAVYNQWLGKYSGDTELDKTTTRGIKEVFELTKRVSPALNKKGSLIWSDPARGKFWGYYVGDQFPGVMLYMDPMHVSSITPDPVYFQGEWRLRPNRMMYNYHGIPTYMAQQTVKSYQDFLLYYYDRMLATDFVKILYFDEIGFNVLPTYNPGIGKGFINEEGLRVGSRSLFECREFFKRLATLYHQRKLYPRIIVHMTNQMLIPCFSFVNMILDWEDKYDSPNSVLRRFPDDFVRAESIGIQAGCVPLGLLNLADAPTNKFSKAQLERSYWANMLLHGIGNPHGLRHPALIDFGYWDDDCEFVPYWKKSPLIKADKDTVKISFYRKKDKILMIVVNYGATVDCGLIVDLNALGLPSNAKATDPETKRDMEQQAGKWTLPLPREDYRLVVIQE